MPLPNDLAKAVQVLGERDSWRVHELPPIGDWKKLLKELDRRGLIEIHLWAREHIRIIPFQDPNPEDIVVRRSTFITSWFSPTKCPHISSWDALWRDYQGEISPEIRLTQAGLKEMDELPFESPDLFATFETSVPSNEFDSRLNVLVANVHNQCRDRKKLNRYRTMVVEWARNDNESREQSRAERRGGSLRSKNPDWSEGNSQSQGLNDPVRLITDPLASMATKYTMLAALHDVHDSCDFPIIEDSTLPGALGIGFAILKKNALKVDDNLCKGLEKYFADVCEDLTRHCLDISESGGLETNPNAARDSSVAGADTGPELKAVEPPNVDNSVSVVKKNNPSTAELRAAASFEWVCKEKPDLMPTKRGQKYSKEQWEYIRNHDCPAYRDLATGECIAVPNFENWKRYVRGGQYDPRQPKTTPRDGRPHGKTIVKAAQL